MSFDYDAVVIGGGSAGYAAARTLAGGGVRTALVESGPELGGLCILRGCMPTKALLHAAELRHAFREAARWGITADNVRVDWANLFARKDELIADFAGYRRQQLEAGKFRLIRSRVRFTDTHTLELADGSRLSAAHFVIATGSVVPPPPIPGLIEAGYLTSDDALRLRELPASVAVLGGGAVALEFAQFFARLGSDVTVIQRSAQVLRDTDEDVARELEKALRREGIRLLTGTQNLQAERVGTGVRLTFEHQGTSQSVDVATVLHGLGRRPNTDSLDLAQAKVLTEAGRILTDPRQRTSAPHIYAAGDCCGPHEIVHVAIQQGETAARNILNPTAGSEMDYRILLSVVFTDPAVATVGLSEKAARADGRKVLVATYPFNDHGKSMILGCHGGFVKLLADAVTGEIVGGACVGPQGGELIHEIAAAMGRRMTVRELAALPHYHPTLAEIWTYPAEELADQLP
jgi:pyruvate/2-oxoglutarate dehydrogenase complex dihydrolipoamide dehydrogenase (E3) component